MTHWIRKQIDSGFADLKGLRVNATIPLKDQFINEALAEFLQSSGSTRLSQGLRDPIWAPF